MITIIVLLILAGVALNTLFGENGIINNAQEASIKTDIAETKEQIEIELAGKYNENGAYTNRDVIEAVKKVTGKEAEEKAETVVSQKGNEVEISDLWVEGIDKEESISTETSYVGYYADVDGNGTVDGVIFADLAIGGSGHWGGIINSGEYEYSAESEGLKNYTIAESYEGAFGPKEVIKATGTGKDRFYVMSLDDFTIGSYNKFYWYYNAVNKLLGNSNFGDFGQGKRNTIDMLNNWNNNTEKYGEQTTSESGRPYIDMWGAIQDGQYKLVESEEDSGRWFIPSESELAAFGDAFKIDSSNYTQYGLNTEYWASSYGAFGDRMDFQLWGMRCIRRK